MMKSTTLRVFEDDLKAILKGLKKTKANNRIIDYVKRTLETMPVR